VRNEGLTQQYDVIICDSSDPIGPADVLFQPEFFLSLKNALNPTNGIICTQGECLWLHMDLIENVSKELKHIFPKVNYAYTTIPTYPSGQIGFMIASLDGENQLHQPKRETGEMSLKYYSSRLHPAAFVLPSKKIDHKPRMLLTNILSFLFLVLLSEFAEDRLNQHL
jgi:spermidine synthase